MASEQRGGGVGAARAAALLMSCYATILALALMYWARQVWQIRTLPERVMEAALRLVPPAQFEAGIDRFGPAAKEYGLDATTAGLALLLIGVGYAALRALRRPGALLELGIALWFVGLVVVMPLTGGGVFGARLLVNPLLVNLVYFGVSMAYATALLLGQLISRRLLQSAGAAPAADTGRRSLLLGAAGSALSLVAALAVGRVGGLRGSSLPLATVPVSETPAPTALPAADATAAAPLPSPQATAAGSDSASTTAGQEAGAAITSGGPSAAASAETPSGAATETAKAAAGATTKTATAAGATATPNPAPTAGPEPAATAATGPAAPPSPSPAPMATAAGLPAFPEPPTPAPLARDKDGAALAVRRAKGVVQALVTPSADFYVVTKNAAGDPTLSARDWHLVVDGAVQHPVQLDYSALRRLPPVTVYKTLECISNLTAKCDLTSFGCDLISTAKWTGARLPDVLALAGGLQPGAVSLVAFGADEYSSALPEGLATDPAVLLAYAMNDTPLPREHGFPVRLLVPGRYGMKSAKWVIRLQAMAQPYTDWWGQRNWNEAAIVKTMARIDLPTAGAVLAAGEQAIGGIAYAGDRGIAKVEFSADAGATWREAALQPGPGKDTFARWSGSFRLAAGGAATLVARATDGAGNLQPQAFSLPQPNGGAGWDSITVRAG